MNWIQKKSWIGYDFKENSTLLNFFLTFVIWFTILMKLAIILTPNSQHFANNFIV
jgi:hypothetical protein